MRGGSRLFWAIGIAWACLLLAPTEAGAQVCNVGGATDMNFFAINTAGNGVFAASAQVTLSCTGNANTQLRVCPHVATGTGGAAGVAGPRYMTALTNRLNFDVFTTGAYSQRYANGVNTGSSPQFTISLNASGAGSSVVTYHGRIPSGQTAAPPGTYSSTLSSGTQFDYGYTTAFSSCGASNGKQTRTHSFVVTAKNQASCTVTTATVAFPQRAALDQAVDGQGAVNVTCTPGTPYVIALNGGQAGGTSATTRRMSMGASRITYGLYQDSARTTGWFNTTGTTVSGSGTGVAAAIPVYGRVPVQTTPPAGTYADTVIVTVTY